MKKINLILDSFLAIVTIILLVAKIIQNTKKLFKKEVKEINLIDVGY